MLDPREWQQLRLRRVTADRLSAVGCRIAKAHKDAGGNVHFSRALPSYEEIVSYLLDRAEAATARSRRYRQRKKCSTGLDGGAAAG